ncbi:MAG: winged helix DNA-binding domain protein [Rhizobium sp.]|nr:winged helix DNA-binding domain protein [Rhizobium sp.]
MQTPPTIIEDFSTLTRKMRTVFDAMVREKGLTLARARILRKLQTAGAGATQRALAEDLEIEGPTLVRLLDNLEQLGFLERIPVEGDRRAKQIILTKQGQQQAEEVEAVAGVFRETVFAGIDQAEMDIARKVVAQMHKNLGAQE